MRTSVIIGFLILGGIAMAPVVHADGILSATEARAAAQYGSAICSGLRATATQPGFEAQAMTDIEVLLNQGFAPDSVGDIINAAVASFCPDQWGPLAAMGQRARDRAGRTVQR